SASNCRRPFMSPTFCRRRPPPHTASSRFPGRSPQTDGSARLLRFSAPSPKNERGPMPVRPRVSLCLIVRNEEQNLPACLAPVAPLVDEMVVVDTGSIDNTPRVAAELGARVFDFAWQDDFAAARNESLRRASGDWALWLDADDRLDAANVRRLSDLLAALG